MAETGEGYSKQAFRQHVVNHQKSYAAVVGQNSHTQPKTTQTYQFTAEQLTKFVANVAIQIAQPQVCYPNPKQDMLNLKSSMCRKVSTVAKTILQGRRSRSDHSNLGRTNNLAIYSQSFVFSEFWSDQ